jgi:hypothetical protein
MTDVVSRHLRLWNGHTGALQIHAHQTGQSIKEILTFTSKMAAGNSSMKNFGDESGPSNAYQRLIKELEALKDHYKNAQSVEDARRITHQELLAFTAFLHEMGETVEIMTPIFDLVQALKEIDRGNVETLLLKSETGHKPKMPYTIVHARTKVVFACDILMNSGMKRDEALRYCARKLGIGLKFSQIKEWRYDVSALFAPQHLEVRIYRRHREQLASVERFSRSEAHRIADEYLESARLALRFRNRG